MWSICGSAAPPVTFALERRAQRIHLMFQAVGLADGLSSNTTLSYLDVQNTGTATNAGSILRLISKNAAKSADNTVDFVSAQGGAFYINHHETNAAASMNFRPRESTRMTIRISAGDVGIGSTNPLAKLDVNGTISASDAIQVGTSSLHGQHARRDPLQQRKYPVLQRHELGHSWHVHRTWQQRRYRLQQR